MVNKMGLNSYRYLCYLTLIIAGLCHILSLLFTVLFILKNAESVFFCTSKMVNDVSRAVSQ